VKISRVEQQQYVEVAASSTRSFLGLEEETDFLLGTDSQLVTRLEIARIKAFQKK